MDRETEELVCSLQAQLHAQRLAIRALARTQSDPAAVLAASREGLIEAQIRSPVLPAHSRNSDYLADQVRASAEGWTADLVELAVPAAGTLPT